MNLLTIFLQHLRRDVRKTTAYARRTSTKFLHIGAALTSRGTYPGVLAAEDFGYTKVGDLQVTFIGHQQVLQFDVAMSDAVGMKVRDTTKQLLEQA